MNRRTVILSGFGALAAAIPLLRWLSTKSYPSDVMQASAYPALLSLIASREDIIEIGKTVKSSLLSVFDEHELTSAILENIPVNAYQPLLKPTELKLYISKKIQKEFQNGEIEVVKGWVLSKTEVMQCRVYNLLVSNS